MAQQLENIDEIISIKTKTGQYTGSADTVISAAPWFIPLGYHPHGKGIMRYSDDSVCEGLVGTRQLLRNRKIYFKRRESILNRGLTVSTRPR